MYEDIDQDIYEYYLDTINNNGGDRELAIAETSLYFMKDDTLIEDIINSIENSIEGEDYA